jgi:hypothetical protein
MFFAKPMVWSFHWQLDPLVAWHIAESKMPLKIAQPYCNIYTLTEQLFTSNTVKCDMRYSQQCCWGIRSSRMLCCVRWVIPNTSHNCNVFVFNSEAVKEQFFTLDCLTLEGEGSMILLKCRKPLAQRHSVTSQKNWIVCTVVHSSEPFWTSCQLISKAHCMRLSWTTHSHYVCRAVICRFFHLFLTDLV